MTSSFPLHRRSLLALALGAAAGLPLPALAQITPEDRALVSRATAYLEGMGESRARFTQVDARGATSHGTMFLKRPGKARFAYDAPSRLVVVSDGHVVAIADARLKTFDTYPLVATPLSLFLAKTIRLDKGVQVSRVDRQADGFTITARDGRKQTAGQISLTFTHAPMTLRGWSITDAQGRITRVQLQDLVSAPGLDPALFVLKDPRPKAVGRGKL